MLQVKPVSRCLERRSQIFGYDLIDIFVIFAILSALNFFFGQTNHKLFLIWIPSVALALGIRVMKVGKPDNYLLHLLRFHFQPKLLFVFKDSQVKPFKGLGASNNKKTLTLGECQ